MVPGWSPIKAVQTVPIGCISRSRGQEIGFQNAIFKNLLVRNYKAQRFHIWYIHVASSRGPLPKLFKLCPWGQNCFCHFLDWAKLPEKNHIFQWAFLWGSSFFIVIHGAVRWPALLKSPEHGWGINMGKILTFPRCLYNSVIEHKQ